MTSTWDLARILRPISEDQMLREYWSRRPLHITGASDKFSSLFDIDRFWQAIERSGRPVAGSNALAAGSLQASFSSGGHEEADYLPIVANQARVLFKHGATICFTNLGLCDRELHELTLRIQRRLEYPGVVKINGYYSPDGRGFGAHFDARIATTLQVHGAKTWRISERAAVDWPISNANWNEGRPIYFHDRELASVEPIPSEASFKDVRLDPGDVLMLPAGTWHACAAAGESLALNVAFEPISLLKLIGNKLEGQLRAAGLRAVAPALTCADEFWEDRPLPKQLAAYVQASARELHKLVEDPFELKCAWAELVLGGPQERRVRWPRSNWQPRGAVMRAWTRDDDAAPLGPRSKLRLNSERAPIFVWRADGIKDRAVRVFAAYGQRTFDRPEILSILRGIARRPQWTALECRSWSERSELLTDEELDDLMRDLLDSGAVELVDAPDVDATAL